VEDRGLHLGRRPERARRHAQRHARVAVDLGQHRQASVDLAAGRRGHALGHLALEHERHLVDRGARLDERHEDGLADAVREVADDEDAAAGRRREARVAPATRVRLDDLDPREARAQSRDERRVDLERDDAPRAPRELAREGPLARPDLDDQVVRARGDEVHDRAGEARVAQEVLPERAAPTQRPVFWRAWRSARSARWTLWTSASVAARSPELSTT